MTEQLKPCYHCGEPEFVEVSKTRIYDHYFAQCDVCGQRGVTCSSEEEATEAWNHRPEEDRLRAIVEAQREVIGALDKALYAAHTYAVEAGADDEEDERLWDVMVEAEEDLMSVKKKHAKLAELEGAE